MACSGVRAVAPSSMPAPLATSANDATSRPAPSGSPQLTPNTSATAAAAASVRCRAWANGTASCPATNRAACTRPAW